ncbi:MAG TPA: HDOD domain-containing protein [Verrucomicrobiae bacterium]|nr:HDOD domain-containing protein [Verrucomicrobiae bacterium]
MSALPCTKRILLLGGEGGWFNEFNRGLSKLRPNWSAGHVPDASQAGSCLQTSKYDVLVIHDSVPEPTRLLSQVEHDFPGVYAFSLLVNCKLAAPAQSLPLVPAASDGALAAEMVVRNICTNEWTEQAAVKGLLIRIRKLPMLPRVHAEVTKELQSPDGSLEQVADYVRRDPIMCAKFLQVINSAFFGLSRQINDPGEAVMLLGAVRTRGLILISGVFSQFDDKPCPGFSAENLLQHSLRVASLAQRIMLLETDDPDQSNLAFTAGLLHDVGKLVLAANVPEMFATAQRFHRTKRITECAAELDVLGTTHAELAGSLLAAWNLPLAAVEAIAWHHVPCHSCDLNFSVLTAVHVANVFAHEAEGAESATLAERPDRRYLERLGLVGRTDAWREGCGLPPKEDSIHTY